MDTGVKAQGNIGTDGQTPHIGDNGNWWIGTTDTGVKAQGDKGADAIAPQVRINADTNEWEISTDGGKTWNSTGVKAPEIKVTPEHKVKKVIPCLAILTTQTKLM